MRRCILLWDGRGPSSTLHHHGSPSTALRNSLPSHGGCQCPAPTIPPTCYVWNRQQQIFIERQRSETLEDNKYEYHMHQDTNHHIGYRKKRRAIMLTLGAEAWSWPIPLICSGLFFANFVLVSSRLQGGKFLAREWRPLV